MVKKKKWIDKSKAQTFTLTRKYVDSDDEEGNRDEQQQQQRGNGYGGVEDYDMDPDLAELLGMARWGRKGYACRLGK